MKNLERCPICHLAYIPDELRDIWEKKFGTREKPHYLAICKLCGKTAGEHYGTYCRKKLYPPCDTGLFT